MYSIFSSSFKRNKYLKEGEPPPKKLAKEDYIKNLSEKQLKTTVSLSEQLAERKEFLPNEELINITSQISGERHLQDFIEQIDRINQWNSLKKKTLDDKDIEMFKEYKTSAENFWTKYKRINKDVLQQYIKQIEEIVNKTKSNGEPDILQPSPKDLKNYETTLSHPMDEVARLEKQISEQIKEYSHCDIKQIRKKARSLSNQIKNLKSASISLSHTEQQINPSTAHSLWDVKEMPKQINYPKNITEKNKTFSCKPQSLYTIKNGEIVKLTSAEKSLDINNLSKMSLDEIRKIPKFSTYETGTPSNILYIRNFPRSIRETQFRQLLRGSIETGFSVKLLNGKLRGQAFIEFIDEIQAGKALDILNGVVLTEGKPLVVAYAKSKTDLICHTI